MAEEVKNEILNLRNNYCIILTTAGQNNLRIDNAGKNLILLGFRSHYALFSTQREYDFTNYFEGGKI